MNSVRSACRKVGSIGSILIWAIGLSACMVLPTSGADSWKEEVLLHDGQKIVVERSQIYGPTPVIDKWPLVREHTLRFSLPGSTRELRWTAEYAADIGGYVEFVPLALHVQQATPYVIAAPVGCQGYNKWGRPNPPYVVFKHDGTTWQRISLTELPTQFKDVNLVVSASAQFAVELRNLRLVDVVAVRRLNESTQPPEFKTIVREAMPEVRLLADCELRVLYKGRWILPNDPIARKFIDSQVKE